MADESVLPHPKPLRDLLQELLDRPVSVEPVAPWKPEPAELACTAEMLDDRGRLRAVVALDLALAVHAGAAIGLVPAPGARIMVEERTPTEMVLANTAEVLNVLSSLWNLPGRPHVKLGPVHLPGAPRPLHVDMWLATIGRREDLHVDIGGYGSGRLTMIATA